MALACPALGRLADQIRVAGGMDDSPSPLSRLWIKLWVTLGRTYTPPMPPVTPTRREFLAKRDDFVLRSSGVGPSTGEISGVTV